MQTHAFFVTVGVFVGAFVVVAELRRSRTFDRRLYLVILGSLFFGAVGAKLSTLWLYLRASDPTFMGALVYGGKSVLGGLAGAYVGVLFTKRLVGYQGSTGDFFAPGVALGMSVGRWGCFLTEQIGTPTGLPWGLKIDAQTAARIPGCDGCELGLPMHPSFLYEIVFQLLIFGLLMRLRGRLLNKGDLFKLYLLSYVFRFAVEFVRGNPKMWGGLSGSQLFLIPSSLILLAYFARNYMPGIGGNGKSIPREEAAVA